MQVWTLDLGIAAPLRKFNGGVTATISRSQESSPVLSF
jgi:hypothetical protein